MEKIPPRAGFFIVFRPLKLFTFITTFRRMDLIRRRKFSR